MTDPLRLTPAEVEQVEAALTAEPRVIPELARLIARVHELEGLLIDTDSTQRGRYEGV
jgi:hypothetical protein